MSMKDGGGSGSSNGIKTQSVPGGTLKTSFPQDNNKGMPTPGDHGGGSFGGSDTNLSHSLKGSSAVQK